MNESKMLKNVNPENVLYHWVKKDVINFKEFVRLNEILQKYKKD